MRNIPERYRQIDRQMGGQTDDFVCHAQHRAVNMHWWTTRDLFDSSATRLAHLSQNCACPQATACLATVDWGCRICNRFKLGRCSLLSLSWLYCRPHYCCCCCHHAAARHSLTFDLQGYSAQTCPLRSIELPPCQRWRLQPRLQRWGQRLPTTVNDGRTRYPWALTFLRCQAYRLALTVVHPSIKCCVFILARSHDFMPPIQPYKCSILSNLPRCFTQLKHTTCGVALSTVLTQSIMVGLCDMSQKSNHSFFCASVQTDAK